MKAILFITFVLAACSSPTSKDDDGNSNAQTNNVNAANSPPNNTNAQNSTNPTFVDPDDFDRSCEIDPECGIVFGGDICGCPDVCGAAISRDAVADFEATVDAIECPANNDPTPCPAIACEEQIAVCFLGTCGAIGARRTEANQFDQSCTVDEDCVLVVTGVICNACDCSRGAINVDAVPEYEAAREADCNPGPSPCDCAPLEPARCDDGTCAGGSQ